MRIQSQYPEFRVVALLAVAWVAGCAATDTGVRADQIEQPEDLTMVSSGAGVVVLAPLVVAI